MVNILKANHVAIHMPLYFLACYFSDKFFISFRTNNQFQLAVVVQLKLDWSLCAIHDVYFKIH